ncbi:MAG TPA: hypothetical protein VG871_06655 [Vicinamibacterales bacterium]|nr:hypothetical protein [Vicinamibacterales bacterium]
MPTWLEGFFPVVASIERDRVRGLLLSDVVVDVGDVPTHERAADREADSGSAPHAHDLDVLADLGMMLFGLRTVQGALDCEDDALESRGTIRMS